MNAAYTEDAYPGKDGDVVMRFLKGASLGLAMLCLLMSFGAASASDPCWGLNRLDCNTHPSCEWPTGVFGHCYFTYHSLCECRELQVVVSDLCEESVELYEGFFDYEFDSAAMTNAYDQEGACTGYSSAGPDGVAYVELDPGGSVMLYMEPIDSQLFDASLYMVTDCTDPVGTCVAGSDDTVGGGMEQLGFTSDSGGIYFIVFDAYSAPEPAMVHVWGEVVGSATPTRETTWSLVKTLYR